MYLAANAVAQRIEVCSRPRNNARRQFLTRICADTGSKSIVTQTKPSDFPSFLRQKLQSNVQAVEKHNIQTDSISQESCPVCARENVKYTNVQLRGADEGSTVIYLCDCGNS